jgi:hypothetical protein
VLALAEASRNSRMPPNDAAATIRLFILPSATTAANAASGVAGRSGRRLSAGVKFQRAQSDERFQSRLASALT